MTLRLLALLLVSLCSAGTAEARSVNPKHLEAIDPPVEYRLGHDVSVQGDNILYTLRAGKYVLRYQDRRGQYFTGEGDCMHLDIRTPKMTGTNDWTCGIFVPKDPKRGASFFRIRYGYGSFDWPDKAESMELREKLLSVEASALLVAPLRNQQAIDVCGSYVSSEAVGSGYIFLSAIGEPTAYMNIGGQDLRLESSPPSTTLPGDAFRVGDRWTEVWTAPDVRVEAEYSVTGVCQDESESCEVTQVDVTFTVRSKGETQVIQAKGSVGC